MNKLKDKWIRVVRLPLVAVLGNFVFYEPDNTLRHVRKAPTCCTCYGRN